MEKFIPYEKLSKKKKKELNAAKRSTWNISPVTRRPENPKAYNRRKALREDRSPNEVLFIFAANNKYRRFAAGGIFHFV
ncbi:MAG: hypothetical protein MJ135_05550 [Oscillospiraceae bacterium]|nr:hypothetical protein [Oscillospiraceae bacterium]